MNSVRTLAPGLLECEWSISRMLFLVPFLRKLKTLFRL
jgi:hypothetical protein